MSDESPFPPLPPDEAYAPNDDDFAYDDGGRGFGGRRGGGRGRRDQPRRRGGAGRVPPHNLEAEESVLGALLLSRDAIGIVAERGLTPDMLSKFY